MTDVFKPEERSRIMAKVRGKDTSLELSLRSLIHGMGFRYRLHVKELPGKPDMVFPRHRKVIFINGCFWHQHEGCPAAARPASNTDYWNKKLEKNLARDKSNIQKLEEAGWKVLTVWECEIKDRPALVARLRTFFESTPPG